MPFLSQFLFGLAAASPLFLVAAGLTLMVAVAGTANLSLGALALVGAALARGVFARLPLDSASAAIAMLAAAVTTAVLGALLDIVILRRLRSTPASFTMVATLGIALLIDDVLPLIPGDAGPMLPSQLAEIAIGPAWLVLLLLLTRTAWGAALRATRLDVTTATAPGVGRWLQTSVAALGAGLAGLAGAVLAMQGPIAAGFDMDLLTASIVVVVIGGLGSVPGAYIAALVVGLAEAFGPLVLPHATLVPAVALLVFMLIVRPAGLLGRRNVDRTTAPVAMVRPTPASARLLGLLALLAAAVAPLLMPLLVPGLAGPELLPLLSGCAIAVLFAASLQILMGPAGMPSLGHAAFFGIGAYTVAALIRTAGADPAVAVVAAAATAGLVALVVGALLVRQPAVAVGMLSLVFAQFMLILAQLDTGWGGRTALKPPPYTIDPAQTYWVNLAVCTFVVLLLRRLLSAPFGYALRAARDDPRRAVAMGLPVHAVRLAAFTLAGTVAGVAGGLASVAAVAFTGQVLPDTFSLGTSLDGVLMVLLGGMQALSGPIVGALAVIGLQDAARSMAAAWHPLLGLGLIAVVMFLPEGIAGSSIRAWRRGV